MDEEARQATSNGVITACMNIPSSGGLSYTLRCRSLMRSPTHARMLTRAYTHHGDLQATRLTALEAQFNGDLSELQAEFAA